MIQRLLAQRLLAKTNGMSAMQSRHYAMSLIEEGQAMVQVARARLALAGQRGSIDIAALMMLGIGMIFIAVGFIIFPVVIDGTDEVLNHANIANYTGLADVTAVAPLIVLVGFIAAGIITGFFGVKKLTRG